MYYVSLILFNWICTSIVTLWNIILVSKKLMIFGLARLIGWKNFNLHYSIEVRHFRCVQIWSDRTCPSIGDGLVDTSNTSTRNVHYFVNTIFHKVDTFYECFWSMGNTYSPVKCIIVLGCSECLVQKHLKHGLTE